MDAGGRVDGAVRAGTSAGTLSVLGTLGRFNALARVGTFSVLGTVGTLGRFDNFVTVDLGRRP